jgi:signal transduction histidine kinase
LIAHGTAAWQGGAAVVEWRMTQEREGEAEARAAIDPGEPLEAAAALAGSVAHDLGNMLTVMLGNAELLVEGLASHPELTELAELILGAALRGTELAARLDRFARRIPEADGQTDTAVELARFIERLAPGLPPGIHLDSFFDPDLHRVALPPVALAVALEELANNAVAALGGKGELRLIATNRSAAEGERRVWITVEDAGRGMDPETLQRNRRPRFASGVAGHKTGVGLALALRIARAGGGTLRLDSTPGGGTRAVLDLPAGG